MTAASPAGDPRLARRLESEVEGEVRFDPLSRGLYSTDASFYQINPIGVVIPRNTADVLRTLQIAAEADVPVLPRGAGTSQAGQTVGHALVIDTSKYLTRIHPVNEDAMSVVVEPGVVLDDLNDALGRHGLFFPVDVATSNRATIGGMAGNNSSGARSLRYGIMADNVRRIDTVLAGGEQIQFGPVPANLQDPFFAEVAPRYRDVVRRIRALYVQERDELERRVPQVLRHVAGYNLHRMGLDGHNMAELLVGSEGTLGFFTGIELQLEPMPSSRVLGVCHFPTLRAAMETTQHVVELAPTAVELVDRQLLDRATANPAFAKSLARFVRGAPGALLMVEFSATDLSTNRRELDRLDELMRGRGYTDAVVRAEDSAFQREIWSVRKAGLNIVMSMRGPRKPVSFIEDCAVPLDRLAEYTDRLNDVFADYGVDATWYAHASVGCLHVRPALDLKDAGDVAAMRRIAERAHAIVREFKGSHSGEHGDGIVRSEFLASMVGQRLVRAFGEIKSTFDPNGRFNPGKIVDPPVMDDRSLFRYPPTYHINDSHAALDWSAWGGLGGAVEMCNNNGACRKRSVGGMCPSFRVTNEEQHVTRGRANVLRLALSGQLDEHSLASDALYHTMELCIGCKACRSECPTGVDMARMKIEVMRARAKTSGVSRRDSLVANLPRYAPWMSRFSGIANAVQRLGAGMVERAFGLSAKRTMPQWHRRPFDASEVSNAPEPDVVLFADSFNTHFEPENLRAAVRVLAAAGYRVAVATARSGKRLCCGRTYLNAGMVDQARREMRRTLETLDPFVNRGVPVIGLEPSCLLTFRDELMVVLPTEESRGLGGAALLFEEFAVREQEAGRWRLNLAAAPATRVLVHGHCHQTALGAGSAVATMLQWIPGVEVQMTDGTCCGMAGSFGYELEHYDLSLAIGELDLLPAVRRSDPATTIVADGTSCRAQIAHATRREAVHAVQVLDKRLIGQ